MPEPLQPQTLAEFQSDIIDLFSLRRGGHVQRWLYTDRTRTGTMPPGSTLWQSFLRANRNYYVLPDEIGLIADTVPRLKRRFRDVDTLVDLGPGDEKAVRHKTLPVIEACPNTRIYAPVDLSRRFLQLAQRVIGNNRKGVTVMPFHNNFYRDPIHLPGKNRLAVFFGATISNMALLEGQEFDPSNVVQRLAHIASFVENDNQMLITFDANPDSASAIRAYDNINWRRLITGIMYDVHDLLKPEGDFRPSAWHHEPVWNENAHVIHQCVVASRSQKFSIAGHEFDIQRGQRFVVKNNFKYPLGMFRSLAREAGFKTGHYYQDQGRVTLQHLVVNL